MGIGAYEYKVDQSQFLTARGIEYTVPGGVSLDDRRGIDFRYLPLCELGLERADIIRLRVEGLWAPGTQGGSRRLRGGAEGIRTSDLPSSGTALDGAAASQFRLYRFMRLSDKERRRKSGSALIANGRLTSTPNSAG